MIWRKIQPMPVAKIAEKNQSEGVCFLHSYVLVFRWFCPLRWVNSVAKENH